MLVMENFLNRPVVGREDDKKKQLENDRLLVQRIVAGDEEAMSLLYQEYGQRLYAYAMRITGDPAAAEEVLQDSLVAAWQNASRFRADGRLISWLLGIVHHRAIDLLRKRRTTPLNDEHEDLADHALLPDEEAAASEQGRLIKSGLDCLPLEQRMVLELVFYQGLSLNEVAGVCGCPLGTVKSRLNYAKSALRGVLNRQGLGAEDMG